MLRRFFYPGLLGMLFLSLMLTGCKDEGAPEGAPPKMPPPVVDFHTIETRVYTPESELPGRVAPVRSAQVRARVAGIILTRNFEEGSDVKKGDLLFQIDPAPFQAELARANASLASAEATLFDARTVMRRYESLVKTGAVSSQQYDSAKAQLLSAKAARGMALAEIRTAKLNLGYATVTAPISGRIGRAMATEGALVGQGEATVLATIQQMDPIYVDFTEPVSQYLKLKAAFASEEKGAGDPAKVELLLEDIDHTQEGRFLFSDVTVNQQTGQVSLRSEFANPRALLLPGMFVRVKATLKTVPNAIFIPQRAVLRQPDGSALVMVLDEKNAVQARPVKMGEMKGSDWLVLDGLTPGETIVTTGATKVKPGMILNPAQ